MKSKYLFLLLFPLFTTSFGFLNVECLESFHSDIIVNKDSSLTITETIVYANKGKVVHGIYRSFPILYKYNPLFGQKRKFDVSKVLRDGKKEKYHIKNIKGGKRLYIGNPHKYLQPVKYVYTITYKTDRQLRYFNDHDELYFNVNGIYWPFPIKKVSARVFLPKGIKQKNISLYGYTGKYGSKGQDYKATFDKEGNPIFETTRVFYPNENLTIVVNFPKGIVQKPTGFDNFSRFLEDNYASLLLLLFMGAFIILFLFFYIRKRQTQYLGTIIPLFYPTEGFTPGDVRYIDKIGYDSKVFAAEIVNMAVQGFFKIKQQPGFWSDKYTLIKNTQKEAEAEKYTHGYLMDFLFPEDIDFIELDSRNRLTIQEATKKLAKKLKRRFQKKYFLGQEFYYVVGFLLLFLMLISFMLISFEFVFLMIVPFLLFSSFLYLLKGYNKAGLKIKNEIEGFKLFLKTTEEDRLKVIGTPPTKTPQLYEKYLPYAIALGVEKQWTKKFVSVFAQLEYEGTPYVPIWYVGTGRFDRLDTASFSYFAANLTRSVDSFSGSGSGGRGGSGGGGVGGGGGSW